MTTIFGADINFTHRAHKPSGEGLPASILTPQSPDLKQFQHIDLSSDLREINDWLSESEPTPFLQLLDIAIEDVEALQKEIHRAKRRIKYEWDSSCRILTFRMPCAMHETGGNWLSQFGNHLTEKLAEPARCGQPQVVYAGSSTVAVEEKRREPDGQFHLRLKFGNEDSVDIRQPRVILETSYTQDNEEAVQKIAYFLCAPDSRIHAAIHVAMNRSITLVEDFYATIGVDYLTEEGVQHIEHEPADLSPRLATLKEEMEEWFRRQSQDTNAEEQPKSQQAMPSIEKEAGKETQELDSPPTSPAGSSASAFSGATGDIILIHPDPFTTGESDDYGIECRGGRIVLIDEAHPDKAKLPLPPLILNVYDFLRPCPTHPNEFLPDLELPLPLDSLREDIQSKLKMKREDIRKANEAKAAEARARIDGDEPGRDKKRAAVAIDRQPVRIFGAGASAFVKAKKSKKGN